MNDTRTHDVVADIDAAGLCAVQLELRAAAGRRDCCAKKIASAHGVRCIC
jgi:hypothetical protein